MKGGGADAAADLRAFGGDCLRPGGLELTLRALEYCRLPDGSRVLDVGAGLGATVAALRDRGFDAMGVEPDEALRRGALAAHPDAPLMDGSADGLPWPEACFDAVFAECVLSVVDAAAAVGEIRRVLRPGGRLIVSDIYRRLRHEAAPPPRSESAGGVRTASAVRALLTRHGFAVGLWEDHSCRLAELACAGIMAYGSLPAFLAHAGLPSGGCGEEAGDRGRLGYFLCVARRDEKREGPAPQHDEERAWTT